MSSRQILTCPSQAAALEPAAGFIQTLPRDEPMLILAGTRGAADEILRRSLAGARLGAHRMTLTQLAAQLAAPAMGASGLAPASRLSLEALVARVVDLARNSGALSYFRPVIETPGFARALTTTLEELRLEGVAAEDLRGTPPAGGDLAALLELFDSQMSALGMADLATTLWLASRAAALGEHPLLGLPLLFLDLPLSSSAHASLAAAVATQSPRVLATALAGDRTVALMEAALGVAAETVTVREKTALDRARRHLFDAGPGETMPPDGSLELFSAPGEGLECIEIARRILDLAREGARFDQMAILLRAPERYQPLVEEALRRGAIPGYFTRGTARPDASGRAFLALLACAREGCSASRFAEYLSLGQVPALDEQGAPRRVAAGWVAPEDELMASFHREPSAGAAKASPDGASQPKLGSPLKWEHLLVDAAVVGGRERWARRLAGLESELKLRLIEIESEDDAHRQAIERQLDHLVEFERFALPLIDILGALPRRARWRDWIEALTELAETALQWPESVLATLNELWPMHEVGPVDLDEVYGVLSERLRFLRREPPPRRYGHVFVGTIEEARGRHFDVVFLPGLAEGVFPRKVLEDPLLLDEARRQLPGRIRLRDDRVADERRLLAIAAAAGSRLVVSYPRLDVAQARPRVPSFYALEVIRAAEGRLPDLREFEKRAAAAASARLGWPAPPDPEHAIDDAEYDLAWLDEVLRRERGTARGAGRYLVEANPSLGRALRARWKRWHTAWSSSDGLVDVEGTLGPILAEHRLSARPYSPSALEQYAICPYRFFLSSVLRLRPREESAPLEQMDPLTRGALFHAAQFELFQQLEGAGWLEFPPAQLDAILALTDRTLDRVAARFREDLAPAIPRVWRGEVEDVRVDLHGWLRQNTFARGPWIPDRFEFGFGLSRARGGRDARSTASEALLFDAVRLRGAVDLIERHRDRAALRVTDHKTGKPPDPPPAYTGGGAFLQPALYGLACETLLGQPVESGRLFYATQRGTYREIDIPLAGQARSYTRRALAIIDESIGNGFLPAAPRPQACQICDYRQVCGPYEEERVQRKQPARLEPLRELRRMP